MLLPVANKLHFFKVPKAKRPKLNGRRTFANTSEITEVVIGMNGLPVDSQANTELWGNEA